MDETMVFESASHGQPWEFIVAGAFVAYIFVRQCINTYCENRPERYPDHRHWWGP
jgi:hypothetical protein